MWKTLTLKFKDDRFEIYNCVACQIKYLMFMFDAFLTSHFKITLNCKMFGM